MMGGELEKSKHTPKRTEYEQARDTALALRLQEQGLSQEEIAVELNGRADIGYSLSRQQVGYDIRKAIEAWRQQGLEDLTVAFNRQVIRLEGMMQEAWGAWRRSKDELFLEERTVQVLKEYLDGDGQRAGEELVTESIEQIKKRAPGDGRYLDIILNCITELNRIYGFQKQSMAVQVDKRETVEVTHKTYHVVSPADWDDPTIQVRDGVLYKNGRPLLEGPRGKVIEGEIRGENGNG